MHYFFKLKFNILLISGLLKDLNSAGIQAENLLSWKINDILFFMSLCLYRAGGKSGAMRTCSGCKGRGVKVTMRSLGPGMVQHMQSTCNDCYGEGNLIDRLLCSRSNWAGSFEQN